MKNSILFYLVVMIYANSYSQSLSNYSNPKLIQYEYPDTALYDIYGLDYQFTQSMKHSIRYGSVGAVTGLTLTTGYILANDINDGLSVGILSATGVIVGSGIGYLSGLIVGNMKGKSEKRQKQNNPQFYHKMDNFGYSFGGSGSPTELTRIGPLYSISSRNYYKREYFPERIYLTFEVLDWQGASEDEDSHSDEVSEFRFGTNLRYYIKDRSIINYYYEFGLGYTSGNYWSNYQKKEDFSFPFVDINWGIELNMFDFFYGDLTMVLEPLGPYYIIDNKFTSPGNVFMFRVSVGTYIF